MSVNWGKDHISTNGEGIDIENYGGFPGVNNGVVSNNYVDVQLQGTREYGNTLAERSFHIRNQAGAGGPITNLNIFGNTLIATTTSADTTVAWAGVIELSNTNGAEGSNANINFYNNLFQAVTVDPTHTAAALNVASLAGNDAINAPPIYGVTFTNNTFASNQVALEFASSWDNNVVGAIFNNSTITKLSTGATVPFYSYELGIDRFLVSVNMINTTYTGGATPNSQWWGFGNKSLTLSGLLNVQITDQLGNALAGANVSAVNAAGQTVWSGTTSSTGQLTNIVLAGIEYQETDGAPVPKASDIIAKNFGPYTIEASYTGQQQSQSIALSTSNSNHANFVFNLNNPPPAVTLTSLDLTNPIVKTNIITLINNGIAGISGTDTALIINASASSAYVTLASLTALNIPQGDSITFTNFTSTSPAITVNLTSNSTTTQAIVNGALRFSNTNNSVGQLTITSTQAGPALLIGSTGSITSDKQLIITAPEVQNNGTIKSSNNLTITSNRGSIYGTGAFQAPTVSLTATAANIGGNAGATTALLVNSGSNAGLNLTTAAYNINLSDTTAEAITLGACNVNTSLSLTSNGTITFTDNVGSTNCSSISVVANGSGSIFDAGPGSYAIIANSVSLTAAAQIGTPGLRVNCTTLAANGTTTVHVNDLANTTVTLNSSSAGSNFTFTTTSNIIIAGNVTVANNGTTFIATTAGSAGSITVGANANVGNYSPGGNSVTSLITYGSGGITDAGPGNGVVQGNTVNLSSLVGGEIGPPGMRVIADFCNANSSGNVHINSKGLSPITFTSVTGNGSFFQVLANSAITVTGPINAPTNVLLEVISGGGGITLNSTIGTPTSNTTVIASGSGNVVTGTGGLIQGSSVTVSSVSGNLGTVNSPLLISGDDLTLNSGGLTNVSNSFNGAVTLANAVAGGSLNFSSNGPLTINSATSANGPLNLVCISGAMNVAANIITGVPPAISSTNGDITLQNMDTTAGSITIGANSTLHASATAAGVGNVYVIIGNKSNNPVIGAKPANVTVNNTGGGITYFGSNSITASSPNNTLNAAGRNIVFSTGNLPASSISLGGGITITADPPARASEAPILDLPATADVSIQSPSESGNIVVPLVRNVSTSDSLVQLEPTPNSPIAGIVNATAQYAINNSNSNPETLSLARKANRANH